MKRIAYVVVLAASVSSAAAFSACSSDDDAGGGDSGTNSEAGGTSSSGATGGDGGALCAQYAEAVCNRTARCQPLLVDFAFGTLEVCKKGFEITCQRMTTAPGAATFSAACITPFETGCGDVVPDPNCAGSKGTLTDNTPCEFDSQCASGRCGSAGGNGIPGCGVCKPASDASASGSRTPLGGSCNDEGRCEKGLSCADAASTGSNPGQGTCQKMRAIGESCQEVEDCNTGFYGDLGWTGFSVACINGICAKPLDEGATCATAGLNKRFSCDLRKKLLCQGATVNDGSITGTCTRMTFKNESEPCAPNSQTPSGDCRGDLLCSGDAGQTGTCVRRPGIGEASPKDYMCQFGLSYVDGKCMLAPADFCK